MAEVRVEERVVEYVAIDKTGREMLVPHITEELAAKWVNEDGVHIVTRERRRLVPVFGALQTVLPEPLPPAPRCDKAFADRDGRQFLCGFDPSHVGPCGHGPGLVT